MKITNPGLTPAGARRIKLRVLFLGIFGMTLLSVWGVTRVTQSLAALESYRQAHNCTRVGSGQYLCPHLSPSPVARDVVYQAMYPDAYRRHARSLGSCPG